MHIRIPLVLAGLVGATAAILAAAPADASLTQPYREPVRITVADAGTVPLATGGPVASRSAAPRPTIPNQPGSPAPAASNPAASPSGGAAPAPSNTTSVDDSAGRNGPDATGHDGGSGIGTLGILGVAGGLVLLGGIGTGLVLRRRRIQPAGPATGSDTADENA